MDTIPLINPKLIKVSASVENTSGAVLRAEVVSSTPTYKTSGANSQQEYKVTLQVGKQQLETVSTEDFEKGSQLEVKILPGPELRIINKSLESQAPSIPLTAPQTLALLAKPLAQQLLADRIPQIQQQDLPSLIKQLSQAINLTHYKLPQTSAQNIEQAQAITGPVLATKQTTQQTLANLLYQQQGKAPLSSKETLATVGNTSVHSTVEQLKVWIQQLPKGQDLTSSVGLRNALNNAGIQAENQLSDLAQQALNMPNKKSANSIFQQLQILQQSSLNKPNKNTAPLPQTEAKIDLASIVKRTAKTLSDNGQQVLSNLIKTKASVNTASISSLDSAPRMLNTQVTTPIIQNSSIPQWQNPLLNNAAISLEDLLQSPLLQHPSSNNKFALSQILSDHMLAQQGKQPNEDFRIPLNWTASSGRENALIRNIQNLLGHIEREQIQQMQSIETNQGSNQNQLQQNQQWIPLLINHQQQMQLIEFFLDKEERVNDIGEKKQHWFINLHFDLPKLGKLGIEICMLDNECSTTFWSESRTSLSQLTQHIQPLRERLTEQGIVVSDIQSRHGTLEKRKHNIQQRLIDIKT